MPQQRNEEAAPEMTLPKLLAMVVADSPMLQNKKAFYIGD